MSPLPFNRTVMEFLAAHRTPLLTKFFLAVSMLGTFNIDILIITLIYVAWNKQLAIRLSILMFLTSLLNGLLKVVIRNPRPFVREGTYLKKWAVSPKDAKELVAEYSTPSGHAMSSSSFYSYLYATIENKYLRFLAVTVIVLIGVSRPYLGVHYVEDVLLGWALGLSCALAAVKYLPLIGVQWIRLSYGKQIALTVTLSLAPWLLALAVNRGRPDIQLTGSLADAGFLTGIAIACPLERRFVNFNPKSSAFAAKIARFLFTGGLVIASNLFIGKAFGSMLPGDAVLGFLLRYLGFAFAGILNFFLAPLLFTRMRLAETIQPEAG